MDAGPIGPSCTKSCRRSASPASPGSRSRSRSTTSRTSSPRSRSPCWSTTRRGDAAATTGLFLAAEFLPGLRRPRARGARGRHAALACARAWSTRVETLLLGGIALLTGAFWLPLVLVLAFANGALAATGRAVTRSATVALLEPQGALRAGNAALNFGFSFNSAAGPAIAGGLVAWWTRGPAIAGSQRRSSPCSRAYIGSAQGPACRSQPRRSLGTRVCGEAIAHVRSSPVLLRLLVGQGLALALLTMAIPIQVIYAKESLETSDAGFGVFVAAWGVGMIVGSALFARETRRSIRQLIAVSTAAVGLGYIGIAAAPRSPRCLLRRAARRHGQRHPVGVGRHGGAGGDRGALSGARRRAAGGDRDGGPGHRVHRGRRRSRRSCRPARRSPWRAPACCSSFSSPGS